MGEPESTETAVRPAQSRAYWLFGGLFVFLAAVLWLSQRTERAGAPSPLNATLTTTPAPPTSTSIPGVAAVRAFSDTIEKRVYDPKQVIDRAGFADGMQRLAQRLDTERFRTPPPAASPAGTDAMASLGSPVSLSRLSVATPEGLPLPPRDGRSRWKSRRRRNARVCS